MEKRFGYEFIATFMIFLVVCIPIAASSSYAYISDVSVHGSEGIEGYRKLLDQTTIKATVGLEGDANISADQVRYIESGQDFTECTSKGAAAICKYERTDYFTPTSAFTKTVTIGLYDDLGNYKDTVAKKITVDDQPPVSYVTKVNQSKDGVYVTIDVKDTSCTEASCDRTNYPCVGVRDISIFMDENKILQPTISLSEFSKDFNKDPTSEFCRTPKGSSISFSTDTEWQILPNNQLRLKIPDAKNQIGDGTHKIYVVATDFLDNTQNPSNRYPYEFDFTAPSASDLRLYKFYDTTDESIIDYVTQNPLVDVVAKVKISEKNIDKTSITADFSDLIDAPAGAQQYSAVKASSCWVDQEATDVWECRFENLVIFIDSSKTANIKIEGKDKSGNEFEDTLSYTFTLDDSQPRVEKIETGFVKDDDNSGDQCWRGNCYLKPGNNTITAFVKEKGSGMNNNHVFMDLSEIQADVGSTNPGQVKTRGCSQSGETWKCSFITNDIYPEKQLGDNIDDLELPEFDITEDVSGKKHYRFNSSVCTAKPLNCVDVESLANDLMSEYSSIRTGETELNLPFGGSVNIPIPVTESGKDVWEQDMRSHLASNDETVDMGMINLFLRSPSTDGNYANIPDEEITDSQADLPEEDVFKSHVYVRTVDGSFDDALQPLVNGEKTLVFDAMPPKLSGIDFKYIRGGDAADYAEIEGAQNVILEGDGLEMVFYFDEDYMIDPGETYLNLINDSDKPIKIPYEGSTFDRLPPDLPPCEYVESLDKWACGFQVQNVENTVENEGKTNQELGTSSFTLHIADTLGNYADYKFGIQIYAFNRSYNFSNTKMFKFSVTSYFPDGIDRRSINMMSQRFMAIVNKTDIPYDDYDFEIVRGGLTMLPNCEDNPVFLSDSDLGIAVQERRIQRDRGEGSDEDEGEGTEEVNALPFNWIIDSVTPFGLFYTDDFKYNTFTLLVRTKVLEHMTAIPDVWLNCSLDVLAKDNNRGVFYPKQTYDVVFNISVYNDEMGEDLTKPLLDKMKDEVWTLNHFFDIIYYLNYIFKILNNICEVGGIFKTAYSTLILLRSVVMPVFTAVYNIADKVGSDSVKQQTQGVWNYFNRAICKIKSAKIIIWDSEADRNAIMGDAKKDKAGAGATDYSYLGYVKSGGPDIFGGYTDGEEGTGSIVRSICGIVTCAQCTAEDAAAGSWRDVVMAYPLSPKFDLAGSDTGWNEQEETTPSSAAAESSSATSKSDAPPISPRKSSPSAGTGTGETGGPYRSISMPLSAAVFDVEAALARNQITGNAVNNKITGQATGNMGTQLASGLLQAPNVLDPFDNIYTAALCLCVPGFIYNLNKLRQIDCKYIECAYTNSVKIDSLSGCEQQRDVEMCIEVFGAIWNLVPFHWAAERFVGLLATLLHSWPALLPSIGVAILAGCGVENPEQLASGDVLNAYTHMSSAPDCFHRGKGKIMANYYDSDADNGKGAWEKKLMQYKKGSPRLEFPLATAEGLVGEGENKKLLKAIICTTWDAWLLADRIPQFINAMSNVDFWTSQMELWPRDKCDSDIVNRIRKEIDDDSWIK